MPIDQDPSPAENKMSLTEHLEELRRRIIYALLGVAVTLGLSLAFARQVILALEYPFNQVMAEMGSSQKLNVLSIGAGFDLYMRVALYCGLIAASPWIIYQVWAFVSAGLYSKEKRFVQYSIPFSIALFLAGGAFFIGFVAVPATRFLVHFDIWLDVAPMVSINNQIEFMTDMILVFGVAFQMPLATLILAKVGLVSMETLRAYRKHVIFAIVVFSGIFAPPDALSMLAMIFPMWLLYELGVALAYLLVYRREQAEQPEDLEE